MKIGLDLDGVVAEPLFGSYLVKLRQFKERLLTPVSRRYYYPTTALEQQAWLFLNNLRKPQPETIAFIKSRLDQHQFHLITSRFAFLEKATRNWLEKYQLDHLFKSVHINSQDLNPSVFKANIITKLKLDAFVDDDLACLLDLASHRPQPFTRLFLLTKKSVNRPGIKTIQSLAYP